MPTSPLSVPITVEVTPSEVLHGIFALEGQLTYAAGTLTVTYQTTNVRGKKVDAPAFSFAIDTVKTAALKGGMGNTKIILHPKRLLTLDTVPWSTNEAIVFKVQHKHRKQAATLVAQLQDDLLTDAPTAASSIPFQLPSANLGITEIKGQLTLEEEYLVFEVGTGISGGTKKKRQMIKIEPRAILDVWLDAGTFQDKLHIRPKTRELFRAMPGMYSGKEALTLTIAKRHRENTEALVRDITPRLGKKAQP